MKSSTVTRALVLQVARHKKLYALFSIILHTMYDIRIVDKVRMSDILLKAMQLAVTPLETKYYCRQTPLSEIEKRDRGPFGATAEV
jgi:type IV secretory pathway VirB3-like protein